MKKNLTKIPNRTDSLSQAIEVAELHATESGLPIKDMERWHNDWAYSGGVAYGQCVSKAAELETGKPRAKRFLRLTVTRMDDGTYEPVCYIS